MHGIQAIDNTTPHVMIIDDCPEDVRSLLSLFRTQQWRVSVESDPQRGYHRVTALRPDLILLDVNMPRMSGFAFCRLLRETPETQAIPVIFLSSASQVESRLEGFTLGGADYVLKPFEPKEVLARIRVHLKLAQRPSSPGEPASRLAATDNADQPLLHAAMRFIEENMSELPPLANIASSVGTHEKRLSKLFREHLGTSVFAFARQARLRKSQDLLANSGLGIQDIAELVGFRSACNFTTAFREQQGVTPSEFRQQARGDIQSS